MPAKGADTVTEWYIELNPDPRSSVPEADGGWLDIVTGDVEDAVMELDALAESLTKTGFVPDVGLWRNRAGIAVMKRSGKGDRTRWRVRCDSWEGWNDDTDREIRGLGWLEIREAFS